MFSLKPKTQKSKLQLKTKKLLGFDLQFYPLSFKL